MVSRPDSGFPRSQALLTLLATTGLRISEALSRDVEHLSHDRGHRILRLERKGGTTCRPPATPTLVPLADTTVGAVPLLVTLRMP